MKKIFNFFNIFVLALIIIFSSVHCSDDTKNEDNLYDAQSYTATRAGLIKSWQQGNYVQSYQFSDNWVNIAKKENPKDYYINLLEKAKTSLACDYYDVSIKAFQEAEKRFINIEGQLALGEEIGSLFSDDTNIEYEAENYEKLMISPYLLLAYWQKNDFNGAKVEAKRTIQKINQYIESSTALTYLENPFSRIVSALVYERDGKKDDVRIELNKIAKSSQYNSKVAEVLKADILRKEKGNGSIGVFADVGCSPIKFPKKFGPIMIQLSKGVMTSIGFVYSVLREVSSRTNKCYIYIDGKYAGDTYLIYDVENIVMTQFKKNEKKKTDKILARAMVKAAATGVASAAAQHFLGDLGGILVGVAGAVWMFTEKADLRSWMTLPRNIQYRRVNGVTPGEHSVHLEAIDNRGYSMWKTPAKTVNIDEDGNIEVVHFTVTY